MVRSTVLIAFMAGVLLWAIGCAPARSVRCEPVEANATRFEYARVVMGSRARIVLYAPSEAEAIAAARQAFGEMERLNSVLSDYTETSEAMRLCAAPLGQAHAVSPDLLDVVLKSREVFEGSGGAFDPSLGILTRLWRASFASGRLPEGDRLEHARARSGMGLALVDESRSTIELRPPGVRFDFGGIGKGYAADRALRVLEDLGVDRAMVDLGGDLALGSAPPGAEGWRIEASDERGDTALLVLSGVGVATSGDAYRSVTIDGVRYSHILDPRTGVGLRSSGAVTVIAERAWLADALASAASVLGPEKSGTLTERWPAAEIRWRAGRP